MSDTPAHLVPADGVPTVYFEKGSSRLSADSTGDPELDRRAVATVTVE